MKIFFSPDILKASIYRGAYHCTSHYMLNGRHGYWLSSETNLSSGEIMEDNEDVDRLVLLIDISPFLFHVPVDVT